MQRSILSIGILSNRNFAASHEAIESAIHFCRKNKYQLVVSDNSGDAEKETKLRALMQEENLRYIKSPACTMTENWFNTFNGTDGDFVLIMGDDDRIFSFGESPAFTDLPKNVVGIRPNLVGYTEPAGISRLNFSPIQSPSAPDRIVEHLKTSNGANMGIFTFWRREIYKSIMDLWFLHYPTKGTYSDWAVMNGLVSSGNVILDPMSCYFYNLQNWVGDAAFIQSQIEKAFIVSGLPAGASDYAIFFNAIDSFIFINRADSPLSAEERLPSAMFCLDLCLKQYIQNLPQNSKHVSGMKILKLSQKLAETDSLPKLFQLILDIIATIQPGLEDRYKTFYEKAIGKSWGEF